jgi:hypothetical protein
MIRLMVGLAVMVVAAQAGFVSQDRATTVALGFSKAVFGSASVETVWALTGVDGQPAAYMYALRYVDSAGKAGVGSLLLSARDELGPVFMYHKGQSVFRTSMAKATELASAKCGPVRHGRIIYYSPLDIWFEFLGTRESVYVSSYDFQVLGSSDIFTRTPLRIEDAETRDLVREDWQRWTSGANDSRPGQFRITHVPDIDWSYGCGPTATGNILEYWDNNGYWALTDTWFTRWDGIEGEWDYVPNVMQQLAIAAHTDTVYAGGTYVDTMIIGTNEVCNESQWSNCYGFYCYDGGDDHDLMVSELNLVRPVLWGLFDHPTYHNHFVTAMGWGPPDQWWICIHDEWSTTPEEVVIHYNNWGGSRYVIPILPGGGPPGARLGVFPAPSTYVQGLAFDGQNLWATSYYERRIYRLDPDNCAVRATVAVPDSGCTDIAFGNDGYLYVHNQKNRKIYKLTTAGAIVAQYNSPCAYPTGIAKIPGNLYFYLADRDSNRVKKTNTSGQILQSWLEPYQVDLGPRGLCWDYNNHFLHVITDFAGDTLIYESYIFELADPPTQYLNWFAFRTNDMARNIRAVEFDGRGDHNSMWVSSYADAAEIYKVTGFGNHGIGVSEENLSPGKTGPSPLSVVPSIGTGPFGLKVGPLRTGLLSLSVYDPTGRLVRDLKDVPVGLNRVVQTAWDARDDEGRSLPGGTYFIVLRSHDGAWTQKVSIVP